MIPRDVRLTSVVCYHDLVSEGFVGDRQAVVYDMLKSFPGRTDRELAELLFDDDPNMVRPRRKELVDMGLVEELPKRKCSVSGRMALTWRVKDVTTWGLVNGSHPKDCVGDDGFVYRRVVHKNCMVFVLKIVQYFLDFNPKKYKTVMDSCGFEGGVYKAVIRRVDK